MAAEQTIIEIEEWRAVVGWPYEVSSFGRVRRSHGGHCTVIEIRRIAATGVIARKIAEQFNIHTGTVHAIHQRRWRKHVL